MGYTAINRKIFFQAPAMKKTAKPAAKPRKAQRPPEDEEPDPTPKRSRNLPKTPIQVSEEDNVGQSPFPETTEKLYQALPEDLKIPKKNSTGSTTTTTTSKLDPDVSFQDILEEAAEVPSGTAHSKSMVQVVVPVGVHS
eukprot:SAG11_NODE_2215_length_3680_cov_7.703993_1_plen_139_part_00